MSSSLRFYTVDAFTREPFSGNPAAVIVLDQSTISSSPYELNDDLYLKLAAEFNLSETAFSKPLEGGTDREPRYELRWFTPTEEIPLCGHATLATAQIIFNYYHPQAESIFFQTRTRGSLVARKNSTDGSISLDFPTCSLVTLSEGHRRLPKILEKVKRLVPDEHEDIKRIDWADEIGGVVVELSERVDLPGMRFDPNLLSGLGSMVILTQPAPRGSDQDIFSRVFAPDIGVPEDPVTGAAHTALAGFWLSTPASLSRLSNRSEIEQTRTLRAKQVSPRSGQLIVQLFEDQTTKTKRVILRGWAREMMKGETTL